MVGGKEGWSEGGKKAERVRPREGGEEGTGKGEIGVGRKG